MYFLYEAIGVMLKIIQVMQGSFNSAFEGCNSIDKKVVSSGCISRGTKGQRAAS